MNEECIFCKLVSEKNSDEFIYENENFFSIYDINPELKGHALVISKKHFQTIFDLPDELGRDLIDAIKKTGLKLMNKFNGGGFNVINNTNKVAGMIVNHFHIHILPRKKSDNAILKFIDKDTKEIVGLKK